MDILVKGVPEQIGEAQFREWCSIIVERYENAKLNQIKEVVQATEAAKSGIDGFRVANALKPKFAKVEEVIEEVKPEVKEEPKVEEFVEKPIEPVELTADKVGIEDAIVAP